MKFFDDNNIILGLDLGTTRHGVLVFNTFLNTPIFSNPEMTTKELLEINGKFKAVVIEDIDSIHGNIGHTTIETIRNIGRIEWHFKSLGHIVHLIGRSDIKKHLNAKKDSEVTKALKLKYPKELFKQLTSHCISALAVIDRYENI